VRRSLRALLQRSSPARSAGPTPAPRSDDQNLDLSLVDGADREIIERCLPYTMTGVPRLQSLIDAVRYCVDRRIPGAFAECGVWRGGSVLAMVLTLQQVGLRDRDIHLYDTFEGMTEPTEADTSPVSEPALETWKRAQGEGGRPWKELFDPDLFNEEKVRETLLSTGYPADRLHVVKGPVDQTLPGSAPRQLALLRLDTDWYESTRHELEHLYPRLADGGVLVVDDYGHWEGARRAVDEYMAASGIRLLMHRIDYTARIAIKH
jgi:O-methyltransferase